MSNLDRLPNPIQEVWEWQVDAACRGMDTAVFFHPWGERGVDRDRRVARAKAVCQQCPVIDTCRRHALTVQEPYGVWGGLSEEERLILLGRQRRRGESRSQIEIVDLNADGAGSPRGRTRPDRPDPVPPPVLRSGGPAGR
jgi:WhiB family redox-sensing transcriptional regulator